MTLTVTHTRNGAAKYPWRQMVLIGDAFVVTGISKEHIHVAVLEAQRRYGRKYALTPEGENGWKVERVG
jgi:hypothetical protein